MVYRVPTVFISGSSAGGDGTGVAEGGDANDGANVKGRNHKTCFVDPV